MYPETDITITTLEAYKSTALTIRLGANVTANICEGLNLYLSSEYITNLNSDLNYQTRDLSTAFREDGSIDSDVANKLPYTNESLSLSMLNVNFGVRIFIGGSGSKRKSNSIFRNNSMLGPNLMYKRRSFQNNMEAGKGENRTQDNNLSKSNKSLSVVFDSKKGRSDTRATSGSTRSNRIMNSSLVNIKDTVQSGGSKVQNNNFNRSINSSIIVPESDERESLLNCHLALVDEAVLVDIPEEKLKLKTKAQLAKERRKKKRIERRLKRLKAKL
jgi:hypothetical protein